MTTTEPAPRPTTNTSQLPFGVTVERRYTTAGLSPFTGITFVDRDAIVQDFRTGTIIFQHTVSVPDFWDQAAVDILASKYCRKAGVPDPNHSDRTGPETSAAQVITRMASAWRIWGEQHNYFATSVDADTFEDEVAYMLMHQMAAPNSPQWFNTGLHEQYGIVEEPEGNVYWDPQTGTVKESVHKYERSAVNACFIIGVDDSLVGESGILDLAVTEARLFKSGSGSGSNLSRVREMGAPLTGGGQSSGVMSFARAIDRFAGAIKSGGTTRRAAKMVILEADHPDIVEFVESKSVEERVAHDLITAGYDPNFDTVGGAYDIVSFQNANHSVRIPRGFKSLVVNGEPLELRSRSKHEAVVGTIDARNLWQKIAEAAWFCADPGIQFDDIINDWATAPNDGPIRGSNPCSEYLHNDNTACNLASLNLTKFFDDTKQLFDHDGFHHAVRLWTIVLEISVAMSHYPTPAVAKNSYEHRTLGLGYANLGSLVMRAGLPYDSREARAVMGAVTALMNSVAYSTSAELAQAVGPCDAFPRNRDAMLRVLRNHRRAAAGSLRHNYDYGDYESLAVTPVELDHRVLARTPFSSLTEPVIAAADQMVHEVTVHGARNMQATVIAPTGTISFLMGCDTSGPEPDFALVKWKKLVGGGHMKIVNASVVPALQALGYTAEEIRGIVDYALGTGTLRGDTPINWDRLIDAGVGADILTKVEAALGTVGNLAMAFAEHIVGTDLYRNHGIDPASDPASLLLTALGFSNQDIIDSSLTICGHETVEGAPGLRSEDLPVFDTANLCGDGTRFIDWSGHVEALGAIQPHISGGISKTINMPHQSSVDDIARAHDLAYELGVKCVAVYRDGSKASQPLSSSLDTASDTSTDGARDARSEADIAEAVSPADYYAGVVPPRFRLPKTRTARTFSFEIDGMDCYLTAGEYDDGTLGEMWLNIGKDGSTLHGAFSAFSIAVSLGLQRGVPLEHFVEKFSGRNFSPNGMVVHPNLKMASSIPDAVVRLLGWWYLGYDHLVQIPYDPRRPHPGGTAEQPDRPAAPAASVTVPAAGSAEPVGADPVGSAQLVIPTGSPYTGDLCPTCGSSRMVKNGTCAKCEDCGSTTGCS